MLASAAGTTGSVILILFLVVVAARLAARQQAALNAGARKMICPHCQTPGTVKLSRTRVKKGISGGKATGAIFTGGLSLLATGLSRKENHLKARCSNCGVNWLI